MLKRFLILTAVLITTFPAYAQEREYTSGINHTTLTPQIGEKKQPLASGKGLDNTETSRPDITTLRARQYKKQQEAEAAAKTVQKEDKTDENTQDRIWNKYKELANGTAASEAEGTSKTADNGQPPAVPVPQVERPGAPEAPELARPQPERETPPLMQTLIQQYQQNKSQQKQMHSKTLPTPKLRNQGIGQ